MKLIKLNDLEIGVRYINSERLISIELMAWYDDDDNFCEGSIVKYWGGEGIVALSVIESPEEIMEMVNK
nr:MAG TPA: Flagellar and Swarming motility protein [Caudoviricetes sp.]